MSLRQKLQQDEVLSASGLTIHKTDRPRYAIFEIDITDGIGTTWYDVCSMYIRCTRCSTIKKHGSSTKEIPDEVLVKMYYCLGGTFTEFLLSENWIHWIDWDKYHSFVGHPVPLLTVMRRNSK